MPRDRFSKKIDGLFDDDKWREARRLLEEERGKKPESHWVVTQLAVTFYEERQYRNALKLLLCSVNLKSECPLTLWNLAGTLDALGRSKDAQTILEWLLTSKRSAEDDPCWESKQWTELLKADCLFRIGDTLRHQGDMEAAEKWYRKYLELLLDGVKGSYSIEEVGGAIQQLRISNGHSAAAQELKRAAASVEPPRTKSRKNVRRATSALAISELLQGKHSDWQVLASESQPRATSNSSARPTKAKGAARR